MTAPPPPTPDPAAALQIVVGAALLDRSGRVLAAQRTAPPLLAGLWEFPGGKVDPGETDEEALHRECREELGIDIALLGRLGDDVLLPTGTALLRVWLAEVVGDAPVATEHSELRWLSLGELDDVEWIPVDRPLVALLAAYLGPDVQETPTSSPG